MKLIAQAVQTAEVPVLDVLLDEAKNRRGPPRPASPDLDGR